MKITRILLIAVFSFLVISVSADDQKKNKKEKKTVTYKVDMDCHACVNKIEASLPYEKGVKNLKISLEKKEVTVTYRKDKNSDEGIIKAINNLGYKAKVKEDKKVETKSDDKSVEKNEKED